MRAKEMALTFLHEFDEGDDSFSVFPSITEASLEQFFELGKFGTVESS